VRSMHKLTSVPCSLPCMEIEGLLLNSNTLSRESSTGVIHALPCVCLLLQDLVQSVCF
jgi:hypothetical protein